MGRLIDADELLGKQYRINDSATLSVRDVVNVEDIEDAPTVEAIPKADYENRLKADMVAMLTEIQLEIEESENCGKAFHLGLQMASNIIQQKINSLKEKS